MTFHRRILSLPRAPRVACRLFLAGLVLLLWVTNVLPGTSNSARLLFFRQSQTLLITPEWERVMEQARLSPLGQLPSIPRAGHPLEPFLTLIIWRRIRR